MSEPTIRSGGERDLVALTDLYNHYIHETPITFDIEPFTPETRRPWLEQFAGTGPHRLLVAESAGRVVGFACSGRFRAKAAYDTSVETTIYLAHDEVRRGLGTRLYQALFAELEGEDLHRAYAGVTLPNDASLALHGKLGFQPIGIYREVGHKFGRYWDVQWLERALS
jgi:phosphinothricin acetyltransferase